MAVFWKTNAHSVQMDYTLSDQYLDDNTYVPASGGIISFGNLTGVVTGDPKGTLVVVDFGVHTSIVTVNVVGEDEQNTSEVQTLEFTDVVGGTFTLTFDGEETAAIDYDADAATVQTALLALSNLDADDVVVTGTAGDWTFTFGEDFAGINVPVLVCDGTNLLGGNNETQIITITGAPDGGTFTVTYSGQTTGNIAFDASAATVDTALEALSNIGAGDVTVTGNAGGPWTVEFTGALASTNVALMTADGSGLTGGTNPDADVAVDTEGDPGDPTATVATTAAGGEGDTAVAVGGTVYVDLTKVNADDANGKVFGKALSAVSANATTSTKIVLR